MSLDSEATHGAQQAVMTKQQSPSLPPVFLSHLVAHVDPHHRPPPNATLRSAQIACSRWLALRRLRVGLSLQQLATMADLLVETIMLLEAGLADVSMVSAEARQRLVTSLDPQREDHGLASDAIAIALGQIEALSVITMDRVIDDLSIAAGEKERNTILAAEMAGEPDPMVARPTRRIDAYVVLLEAEPSMFDALRVLGESVSHAAAILEAIQHLPDRSRSKQATHRTYFAGMLDQMVEEGLIVKTERKSLTGAPGRMVQYYQITTEGRHALQVVQRHRAIEAAQKSTPKNKKDPFRAPNTDPLPNT